ncbi:MAG TPA: protein phosphatase 2C domain-containing protein [Opitutaceae bacterium]
MRVQITSYGVPASPDSVSEDALRVEQKEGLVIAALADGLGSAKSAGAAAQRAVDLLVEYYLARPQAWTPARALREFATQINRLLFRDSQQRYGSSEMLTTLSVLALDGNRAYGFNLGDSPVYHFHSGQLLCLSQRHAIAEPGMEHVLTRALGLADEVDPFFFEAELSDGDLLCICSDGVSGALSEDRLAQLFLRKASARTLVSAAHDRALEYPELGDDASAIVIEVLDSDWRSEGQRRPVEVVKTLTPGQEIDVYRLTRPLQEGARVWLAENRFDQTLKVLKFPTLEARDEDARRDAFVKEAWIASRIDSPEFVRTSVPPSGPLRYYEMDYIDAPTLRSVLDHGLLKVEEAVALAKFLLRAGQFLLSRDLAHGDLKPENILVSRATDGVTGFKLIDLGSVAELFSVTSRAGTSSYLAPERFHEAPIAERTEIFSIGVILYEALSKTYPYGEIERFQTPRFDNVPRDLAQLNSAVPPWLNAMILRALSPDPKKRYQHFSEMTYELDHPEVVLAFHRKDAPWIERNPLLFYKTLCAILAAVCLFLLFKLTTR